MSSYRRTKKQHRQTSNNVARRRGRNRNRKLALEQCEPRHLLAVFTVTSPLDSGAVGELRWAVNSANANPGADIINFADTIDVINLTQGELPITDPVAINALSSTPGFININASTNSRVFRVDDSNPNTALPVEFIRLAMRQGDVSSFANGQGGTILNHERLTLETCLINESKADVGGAIANLGQLATYHCQISGSEAFGAGGGAIWNAPQATAVIHGGSVYNNVAHHGSGGGILNSVAAEVTISGNAELIGNTAAVGGGGLMVANGGVAVLEATLFQNNTSDLGGGVHIDGATLRSTVATRIFSNNANHGGGIAVTDFGHAALRGSVISGNFARLQGGGILANSFATVDIRGGDITSNQISPSGPAIPGNGGGVFVDDFASVTMRNAIVNYNGATALPTNAFKGGGVFVGSAGSFDADASVFSGNVAFYGAGIYAGPTNNNARANVYISNSNIENNFAYTSGGGIYSAGGVDLQLKCVNVVNNEALALSGGGVQLTGDPADGPIAAEIRDSTVSFNRAGTHGGGVASSGGVELQVENSIITENTAKQLGAGFYLAGSAGVSVPNRTEIGLSLISRNVASDPAGPVVTPKSGGGVWVGNAASLEISATTIEANTAANDGGGVMVTGAASFLLANSTISGNESDRGAGAAVVRSSATFLQSTFYANRAVTDGGGIFVQSNFPHHVDILHSTLSLNSAARNGIGRGGGIWAGDSGGLVPVNVNLDHTIVSTNLGAPLGGFDEIFDSGAMFGVIHVSARYSLIRENTGTSLPPGNPDPNGNIIGSASNPIDAHLGPLGSFGGPTLTMVPSNISPAINRGDPLFSGPPFADQRLAPFRRVVAGVIDMGAVEVQPPPPTPDFNGDGVADCHDVNALSTDIAAGLNTPSFDLTGDGFVDRLDLEKWLDDAPDVNGIAIERYLPADANLDTVVDGQDFVIWNTNKFTLNSNWCDGDFNADGVIAGGDFIVWNVYKFTASPPQSGCGLFPRTSALTSTGPGTKLDSSQFADDAAVDIAMSTYAGQPRFELRATSMAARDGRLSAAKVPTGLDGLASETERQLRGDFETQQRTHRIEALAKRSRSASEAPQEEQGERPAESSLAEH